MSGLRGLRAALERRRQHRALEVSDEWGYLRRVHAAASGDMAAMQHLAGDRAAVVRRAVAQNPACPPDLLEVLADDPDAGVRHTAAQHPACPDHARVVAALRAEDEPRRGPRPEAAHQGPADG